MLPESFAVVGAVIASLGGFQYLYATIKGRAKPNRVTWLLWGLLPMVIFVAQRTQGVEGLSWVSFTAGFTPFLILAASFMNRNAYWQTTTFDYICMAFALLGIALWAITKDANTAIVFSVAADVAAGLPTLIKAYTHPETESWLGYTISAAGFVVSTLAIHSWNFANYGFVVYVAILNGLLAVLAFRGRSHHVSGPVGPESVEAID